VALERNPAVAEKLARRGDEAAGHGYRWSNHFEMNRDDEREAIRRAIESIEKTTGTRPLGWYCREMSVNTRELVVEEGGFVYDSDCYNDDLPYWTVVKDRPHLVVPYGLVVNDARYVVPQGFGSPEHFLETAKAHLDRLRRDGDDVNRMMSIGLHPRITGNPARSDALARFIEYAQSLGDVWFARRIDIANTFIAQQPASNWV
jgi:peptidoglycan/xylan/chitin deacetylase (PgdA/CDA1 family)